MQRLSKKDQYAISRDIKEVLKLWELTGIKPYQSIPEDELTNAQKTAITGLKIIFDRWVIEVLRTAKTPNSRLTKITRLRIYLKEVLNFPYNPRYYRFLPFSLIKPNDDSGKINQRYLEEKEMNDNTVAEAKAEIAKAENRQKNYEDNLIDYQVRLNNFSDDLLLLLERGICKMLELSNRVENSSGSLEDELKIQAEIFSILKNVATVSKASMDLKNTLLQVEEIRQHLAKLAEDKESDRR